jgi:hypothetical protein
MTPPRWSSAGSPTRPSSSSSSRAQKEVGDRLHVAYRFEGVEGGEPYVVEQHLFCTLAGGVVEGADLLCSGFRPRDRE